MIEADKRRAIYLLHQDGMTDREISRRLRISRNTVKNIVEQEGVMPPIQRKKQRIDEEILRRLYTECNGFIQRMYEKLTEEEDIEVTYPTLTRMLRDSGISKPHKERCDRVADKPGVEMQHDTSPYRVKLAGKWVGVIASMLYMRYSKRRYLKFYPVFNRFKMKCFFHEALMYWGYAALQCIIDNTNLARLRGTGADAVIVPEMERFAGQYGYRFRCHEKGHANRKAGEERSFWTVVTNFFPGRTFQSLEDMNRQALEWSTVRLDNRPQGKARLIPAKAFEFERQYLVELPAHLPAPYRPHDRGTDEYGYVAFGGNYYWVPGTGRDDVKILEYADRLKIYQARTCLAEYPLPAHGVRNTLFSPEGLPEPRRGPRHRKKPPETEEKHLRAMSESVSLYLDFALKPKGIERNGLLRKLHALSLKITRSLFITSIERAHKYKIIDMATIERIVALNMTDGAISLPFAEVDENFQQRDAYLEGRLTDPPDLSIYKQPQEDNHE